MIATAKDALATALVAGSVAVIWANVTDVDVPLVSSTRGAALVALALSAAACAVGAQTSSDGGTPTMKSWHDRAGAVLGGVAGLAGVVALISGWQAALVACGIVTGTLWLMTTVRHLVTPRVSIPA